MSSFSRLNVLAGGSVRQQQLEMVVESSCIRLLVVEDFEKFQRLIESILQSSRDVQLIGTISDGLASIRSAIALRPDIILMDIGLPTINGLEAARAILKNVPECRIIFVTQSLSSDLARETFKIGAWGYVAKTDIVRELLPAIKAVAVGNQYISSGIDVHASEFQSPITKTSNTTSLPTWEQDTQRRRGHRLNVYSDEKNFANAASRLLTVAVSSGQSVLVIGSPSLRSHLIRTLQSSGLELGTLVEGFNYISVDADEMASRFMENGWPSSERFREVVGGAVETLLRAARHTDLPSVLVIAECGAAVWAAGKSQAAIRVEELWNELGHFYDTSVVCAYPVSRFHGEEDLDEIEAICEKHSAVFAS